MDLSKIRAEIDRVDDEIATLYGKRMDLIKQVCEAKKEFKNM